MQKSRKTGITVMFSVYCVIAFYFVFIFARTVSDNSFWARMCFNANVVPLKTIIEYTTALFSDGISFSSVAVYTVGNAALAMPLGIFLPMLFGRMRSVSATLLTTASATFVLEFFQFIFKLGSFDIDSVILRTLGAAVGYLVYKRLVETDEETVNE